MRLIKPLQVLQEDILGVSFVLALMIEFKWSELKLNRNWLIIKKNEVKNNIEDHMTHFQIKYTFESHALRKIIMSKSNVTRSL